MKTKNLIPRLLVPSQWVRAARSPSRGPATKITYFIRRYLRVPVIVLLILLPIAVIALWLTTDLIANFHDAGTALNVAKGQLIAEVLGLGALIIAVMEFREVSRKPELFLWARAFDGHYAFEDASRIRAVYDSKPYHTHPGIVDQPITDLVLYKLRFNLLIENQGRRMARFIKATICLDELDEHASPRPILSRTRQQARGTWVTDGSIGPTTGFNHTFYGAEEFVVYSNPTYVPPEGRRESQMELAAFTLEIIRPPDVGKPELLLTCTIQADESPLEVQHFAFPRFPPRA